MRRRHCRGLPLAAVSLGLATVCRPSPAVADAPAGKAASLDAIVSFPGDFETVAQAAEALHRQLGVGVAVRHATDRQAASDPGQQGQPPAGGAAANGTPQRVDLRDRPLREVLDVVGRTFGNAWEEVLGIYVFRPLAPSDAIRDAVSHLSAPSREDLASMRAVLEGKATGRAGIHLAGLPEETQAVVLRALAHHWGREMEAAWASHAGYEQHARWLAATGPAWFADNARLLVEPEGRSTRLEVRYPSLRGERGVVWSLGHPNPAAGAFPWRPPTTPGVEGR